jgi:hypothetical protein
MLLELQPSLSLNLQQEFSWVIGRITLTIGTIMLEHTCLLIHGWNPSDADASWRRVVTDSAGQPLGFVQYQPPRQDSWLAWLRRTRLEVYETEDASHLMTLVRGWRFGRTWNVYDAEDRFVGTVFPSLIVSSDGYRLGEHAPASVQHGALVDGVGMSLLSYLKRAEQIFEIRFTPTAMTNPFLRMLLLSWVLMGDPAPHG